MWKLYLKGWVFLSLSALIINLCWAATAELPWLQVKGRETVNEEGKKILLNGINLSNNVWGNWVEGVSEKLETEKNDPLIRPIEQDNWALTAGDFIRLKKLGPKAVRYAINYELFAEDNQQREDNLQRLKAHIEKFEELGIYVMVSLHLPQGLDVQNDNYERDKPATKRLQSIFENEEYWKNTVKMWQYLAENLKDLPAVAGYSLFNEPRLPSENDGGIKKYQSKHNELIKAIRQIDKKHIIFVAEYNSKERNDKKQSVAWEKDFVKVDDNNVVYVFSFYDPYEYTHLGSANKLDEDQLEAQYIQPKIEWAKRVGQAPLLMCEYGLNRLQTLENRLKYIRFVHKISKKHNLPAIFWEYKCLADAFNKPFDMAGLYAEYVKQTEQVIIDKNGDYSFQLWAEESAKDNKFDELYRKYFWKNKTGVSLMDNEPIWQELHNFFLVEKTLKS